jgi:hypothetical protein
MKHRRTVVLLPVVAAALGLAVYWATREQTDFATPLACLEAYRDACEAGDRRAQLRCLTDELRGETERNFADSRAPGESGRQGLRTLKSWTALEPAASADGRQVVADVEETRTNGKRLVRFHLRQTGRGWLISAIEPPRALPAGISYGTHVSKVPEGAPPGD